jgi:radical SAM superfamily enzyme YgiQ (UPF0313 family)
MEIHPDQDLNCLLIQPRFASTNYWNFVESAEAIGAKAIAPPLGLLTVAAMLPKNWRITLVDLNVRDIEKEEWESASIVCTGGMLPQQDGILQLIDRARQDGKYVVVGGPDPTSQPQLYAKASARVLGEGEGSIPLWLNAWRNGNGIGTFESPETPDISKAPIPRFNLIRFDDYLHVGLQTSRGCPYNCEFCDIIELFGRKPRVKTPEQFLKELDRLYELGYRGWVDIADDNFIGNRQKTKPLLHEIVGWTKRHNYPFVFSTEASVNLADDDELLQLMSDAQFRYVFLGIETPDEKVLAQTQKRINTVRPLIERVRKIYAAGISVTAGFIIGFDSEPDNCDETLIEFIQESGIMLAMIGLLTALPNTQLTRRLAKERRLISSDHEWITDPKIDYQLISKTSHDQTVGGLNFVTIRDRVRVYEQLRHVIEEIYSPKAFMARVLDTTQRLQIKSKHVPGWWETKRLIRGWLVMTARLLKNRDTRWHYLQTAWRVLWMGPAKFEFAHQLMGTYLHFAKQTQLMVAQLNTSIEYAKNHASYPRSCFDAANRNVLSLPVLQIEKIESGVGSIP